MRNVIDAYRTKPRTSHEVAESRDMANYKPYRTREQKRTARLLARKVDGRWVSPAPVSYHAKPGE